MLALTLKQAARKYTLNSCNRLAFKHCSKLLGFRTLESNINWNSEALKLQSDRNKDLEREYHERHRRVQQGGGAKAVQRHVVRNKKILIRERINKLLDKDYPFLELNACAGLGLDYGDVPGGGMVAGIGKISGQLCVISGNDATVKGGTVYPIGVKKQLRIQEIGSQNNLPCVYICDSGGGFLPLQSELYADSQHGGRVFYNEAVMSSKGIPQICIVAGASTAGGAYLPTMCDEVVIVHEIGSLYLGGPPLVQAATGEIVSAEELGGATVHCEESGALDYFAGTEDDAIQEVKNIMLSLNMESCLKEIKEIEEPRYDVGELDQLAGFSSDCGFCNMYDVIARVIDGSRFHEFKPRFGPTLITGFGHLHGHLVGIIANKGALGYKACLKGSHFIEICTQRNIPMIFFQNIEACTNTEEDFHIINAKSKMMACVATAMVPKFTVVMGKSFGEDYFAMCGRSTSPRFLFCWPGAEISMDNASNFENVLVENGLEGSITQSELKCGLEFWGNIRKQSNAFYLESRIVHDGVILPSNTRAVLGQTLTASLTYAKRQSSSKSVLRM